MDSSSASQVRGRSLSSSSLLSAQPVAIKKKPRPMTPNWSQFMHGGFSIEQQGSIMLPMEFRLPQMKNSTAVIEQLPLTENRGILSENRVFEIDDAFWDAWIISLAGESSASLKGSFGRCVVVQTSNLDWIIVEELVQALDNGMPSEESSSHQKTRKKLKHHGRGDHVGEEPAETKGVTLEQEERTRIERRLRALVLTQKYSASATHQPSLQASPRPPNSVLRFNENESLAERELSDSALDFNGDIDLALNWTKIYDDDLEMCTVTTDTLEATSTHSSDLLERRKRVPEPDLVAVPLTSSEAVEAEAHAAQSQEIPISNGGKSNHSASAGSIQLVATSCNQEQGRISENKKTGSSLFKGFSRRTSTKRSDSSMTARPSTVSSTLASIIDVETGRNLIRQNIGHRKPVLISDPVLIDAPESSATEACHSGSTMTSKVSDRTNHSLEVRVVVDQANGNDRLQGTRARPGIPWESLPEDSSAYRDKEPAYEAFSRPVVKTHLDMGTSCQTLSQPASGSLQQHRTTPMADIPTRSRSVASSLSVSSSGDSAELIIHHPSPAMSEQASTLQGPRKNLAPPSRHCSVESHYSEIPREPSPSPVIPRERLAVPSAQSKKFRQSLSRRFSDLIDKFELPRRCSSPQPDSNGVTRSDVEQIHAATTHQIREKWQLIREAATAASHRNVQHQFSSNPVTGERGAELDALDLDDDEASIYSVQSSATIQEVDQYARIVKVERSVAELIAPRVRPFVPYSSF